MIVGDTFRMNVGDTKPYNADFDGDEMNMHMPQNVIGRNRTSRTWQQFLIKLLVRQVIHLLSGIYQDSLLGSYRLTRENINFTPRQAMNLLMMCT